MATLPTPLRAALGIALTAVDTARETATHLPQRAVGLPVAVASSAVQLSLRAQQQYAAFVNKGDELIGALRGLPEEAPDWATFDDAPRPNGAASGLADTSTVGVDVPAGPTPGRDTAFDRVGDLGDDLDDLAVAEDLAAVDLADAVTQDVDEVVDAALAVLDDGVAPLGDGTAPLTAPEPVEEIVVSDEGQPTTPREPRPRARKAAAKKTAPATTPTTVRKAAPARKGAAKKAATGATPAPTTRRAPRRTTTLEGDPLPVDPSSAEPPTP